MTKLEELNSRLKFVSDKIDEFNELISDYRDEKIKIQEDIEKAKSSDVKEVYGYLIGKYWHFKEEINECVVDVYLKVNDVYHDVDYWNEPAAKCQVIEMCYAKSNNDLKWFTYTENGDFNLGEMYTVGSEVPVDMLEESSEEKFMQAKKILLA